jgi:hypothetical protein
MRSANGSRKLGIRRQRWFRTEPVTAAGGTSNNEETDPVVDFASRLERLFP